MRNLVPILAALLFATACSPNPGPPGVTVEDAVVTVPAVSGRPGAAYFTLRTNLEGTRLTGVTSPAVERIELHESTSEGGVMRMGPLENASFTAAAPLVFEPGGKHAMLFGVAPAVRPGGTVPLTFTFEGAPPVTVQAEVRRPGQGGHDGH